MDNEQIKKLKERRDKAWEDAKAILDAAEAEGRDLSGEEQAKWDKANEDMDAIDARVTQVVEAEQRRKDAEDAFAKILAQPPNPDVRRTEGGSMDEQVRAFLRGDTREIEFKPERRADTGLVVGTNSAGGDTVPTDFYGRLVEHMIEVSGLLKAGPTVLRTSSGEPIEVPKTTTHPSAELGSEATAMTESDPVFGQATLSAYKFDDLVQVSRELIDDTAVDLLGYLARACGRAVGNKMGTYLITGSGSSQPSGVVTGASLGVTGATTGKEGLFTADELIDLEYSVIEPYTASPSCGFLMRRATAGKMRKLKNDNGDYLWSPSLVAGRPATFDGFPVWTDPNVAAVATSAKSVLFGDFSTYFVRYAGAIRFERSDEYAFNKDMVTFRCVLRGDGVLVDQTGAVKYYMGASS